MASTECHICYKDYNEEITVPKLLPCGHDFCATCLQNIKQGDRIDCPICRKTVITRVNNLPTVFLLIGSEYSHCDKHSCEYENLYCGDCDTPACSLCTPISHHGHKMMAIKDRAKEVRTTVDDKVKKVKERAVKNKEIIEKWQYGTEITEKEVNRMRAIVKNKADEIINQVRDSETILLKKLDDIKEEQNLKKNNAKTWLENENKALNICQDQVKAAVKMSTPSDIIRQQNSWMEELKLPDDEQNHPTQIHTVMTEPMLPVGDVAKMFGTIQTEINVFLKPTLLTTFQAKDKTGREQCNYGDISLMEDGKILIPDAVDKVVRFYTQEGKLLKTTPSGMLNKPWRTCCLTGGNNNNVIILDQSNPDGEIRRWNVRDNTISRFTAEGVKITFGQCLGVTNTGMSGGSIAVSDSTKKKILLLDHDGKLQKIFNVKERGMKYLASNSNITDNLIINYEFKQLASTDEKEERWRLKAQQEGEWEGMVMSNHGYTIVTDVINGMVQVISPDGAFIQTLLDKDCGLQRPHGVDYNEELGLFCVVEQYTGTVLVYKIL